MSGSRDSSTGTGDAQLTALEVAFQWAELPPQHLRAALRALEPQLQREHDMKLAQLKRAAERESYLLRLYTLGLLLGFGLALVSLAGAIYVGRDGHLALAGILCGPTLVSLVSMFVLREHHVKETPERKSTEEPEISSGQGPLEAGA